MKIFDLLYITEIVIALKEYIIFLLLSKNIKVLYIFILNKSIMIK